MNLSQLPSRESFSVGNEKKQKPVFPQGIIRSANKTHDYIVEWQLDKQDTPKNIFNQRG